MTSMSIFGGAFDPPTKAHQEILRILASKGERVIVVPYSHRSFGKLSPIASDKDRVRMLELIAKPFENVLISDVEIRRGGVSYTLDTVRFFQKLYNTLEVKVVLGSDNLEKLQSWIGFEKLRDLVTFQIFQRENYPIDENDLHSVRYEIVEGIIPGVSSTAFRERMKAGEGISNLVPASIMKYVQESNLGY